MNIPAVADTILDRDKAPVETLNSENAHSAVSIDCSKQDVHSLQADEPVCPSGLHFVRRATAKGTVWYIYAWRGGPRVLRVAGEERPVLTAVQISAVIEFLTAHRTGALDPRDQNLGWLTRTWRESPEWKAFSDKTQKNWSSALRVIERKWGKLPVMQFYDEEMIPQIIEWRDSRQSTPRAADTGISVLRSLLKFGRFRVGSMTNIAAGIPAIYGGGNRAEIIWLDEEIERFVAAAKERGKPALADAIRLAALTGLRRSDLVTVSQLHLKPAAIFKKALKKSGGKRRHVTIPRISALQNLLDELGSKPRKEGIETILVDDNGRSWTPDRLTLEFAIIRDELGIAHVDEETGEVRKKHLHDLRGTFVTKLILETELSDEQIARIMGWSVDEVETIRIVYVDQEAYALGLGNRIPRTTFIEVSGSS